MSTFVIVSYVYYLFYKYLCYFESRVFFKYLEMKLHYFVLSALAVAKFSVMVEAKYCPIELDGDVKYYICPRNEICCTFGCCISSNFHFYQLWYYWLMVILMFLLCSGGTWWYRYWLQEGHYPPAPPPSHRPAHPHLRPRPPTTRVAYHAGRNTVVVQQIWKPQRNSPLGYPTPPPSYSLVQNTSASVQSGASGAPAHLAKLKPSPYYQLYGPPPSYDSVITEALSEHRSGETVEAGPAQHSSQTQEIPMQPSSTVAFQSQSGVTFHSQSGGSTQSQSGVTFHSQLGATSLSQTDASTQSQSGASSTRSCHGNDPMLSK